ncbi:thiaminase II [Bacillus thuringiensis]|uniref:Aminopyrimidine aminohydrolase n=1 Tax=Bacillus thuringiensis TaxID=1428 RepID=A0A9X7AU28_BACTU|nr:thiaminase II [Bacillus thuringiensis]PFT73381.1 thiaminase II [Bacillus thuringiensis]
MTFSQSLRKEVDSIWEASFNHPFVKKLGEGTLDLASFRYYVLQDSYYLSHFAKKLGITKEEKDNFIPAPTAYAYTSHMYRAAYEGHLGDIIAAILPCYWLYYEIGEHLKECQPEEPIYNEWISAYGSDWFRTLVEEQITRLDTIAEKVTEADRKRMKQHFIISSQYEYSFWEMAYTLEKWPVDTDVKDVIG